MPRRRRSSSRCRARACRPGGGVDREHDAEARLVRRACRLLRRQSLDRRTARAPTASSSTCRPTSRCWTHHGWLASSRARPGRSAARPGPPTRCSASGCDAFLAGGRDFTVLFEPGERRALQGFFWSAGRLVLSILDDLQPVFEVLTPSDAGWARRRPDRPAGDRRGRHVAAGCRSVGEQRRPARDRAGSADAAFADAARARQGAGPAQAIVAGILAGRPGGDAARGDLDRRRAHPLYADRSGRRDRRRARASHRLWRLPAAEHALLQREHRQAVAGAGRHQRHRQHPRRRRVRHARGTTPAAARASGCRTTTSPRWRPTWCAAA